jgi:hypothetical protein
MPIGVTMLMNGMKKHRSVSCDHDDNNRADGCEAGILSEADLRGKRISWAKRYREPWEGTSTVSLHDLPEDIWRASRHDV